MYITRDNYVIIIHLKEEMLSAYTVQANEGIETLLNKNEDGKRHCQIDRETDREREREREREVAGEIESRT